MPTVIFTDYEKLSTAPQSKSMSITSPKLMVWEENGSSIRVNIGGSNTFTIEHVSFDQYANALTKSKRGVVDVRSQQKENVQAAQAHNRLYSAFSNG
jgi:hypothetical protein